MDHEVEYLIAELKKAIENGKGGDASNLVNAGIGIDWNEISEDLTFEYDRLCATAEKVMFG